MRPQSFINRNRELGASYPVALAVFAGPLDLLLQLIEREELDISEVSLCGVTDQYLATLEQLGDVDPEALADFLSVASRLLFIKSNHLLPRPAAYDEDEEDAGDALVRQLIEYRRFRQVAANLQTRTERGQRVHVRPAIKKAPGGRRNAPPDLSDVDAADLQAVLSSVLQQMPVEPVAPRVQPHKITVAEQIDRVRDFVRSVQRHGGRRRTKVLFSEVLGSAYTRMEVIVTFLAILELIRKAELAVEQDATFGEIYLLPVTLAPSSGAGERG